MHFFQPSGFEELVGLGLAMGMVICAYGEAFMRLAGNTYLNILQYRIEFRERRAELRRREEALGVLPQPSPPAASPMRAEGQARGTQQAGQQPSKSKTDDAKKPAAA
jgi:hypothetical protein